jgi:glycosyltransferase involved in cell wall biosynthesis
LILKYRRGTHFSIWDYAILWRETCLNISTAQCELPVAVQSMLLAGVGLAIRLAYFHADVISPCASLFNPYVLFPQAEKILVLLTQYSSMWEIEIGIDKGTVGNRNMFSRKVDLIVNGISNIKSFTPVDKICIDKPTIIMLSNIQVIKGVKVAAQAAEIIINRFSFTNYQLVIYNAKDRQPAYTLEIEKFIVNNNLLDKVILAGFSNLKEVLKDTWLFINSSISKGLSLAISKAALAGIPIIATEVSAMALVLTDPKDLE